MGNGGRLSNSPGQRDSVTDDSLITRQSKSEHRDSAPPTPMKFIESVFHKLQRHPKRIVFPEGTEPRVLRAAERFVTLKLGTPVLLGNKDAIEKAAADDDILRRSRYRPGQEPPTSLFLGGSLSEVRAGGTWPGHRLWPPPSQHHHFRQNCAATPTASQATR